jgi:hypothetical protein
VTTTSCKALPRRTCCCRKASAPSGSTSDTNPTVCISAVHPLSSAADGSAPCSRSSCTRGGRSDEEAAMRRVFPSAYRASGWRPASSILSTGTYKSPPRSELPAPSIALNMPWTSVERPRCCGVAMATRKTQAMWSHHNTGLVVVNGSHLRYEAKAATSHLRVWPARWQAKHTHASRAQ